MGIAQALSAKKKRSAEQRGPGQAGHRTAGQQLAMYMTRKSQHKERIRVCTYDYVPDPWRTSSTTLGAPVGISSHQGCEGERQQAGAQASLSFSSHLAVQQWLQSNHPQGTVAKGASFQSLVDRSFGMLIVSRH